MTTQKTKNDFAYFILGYGKPDNISTLELLKKYKVKYPIYIVVGEDDPQFDKYLANKDLNVIIFKKEDYFDRVDELGSYRDTHKVCTYARQFVDDYAKEHGIKYACILFDDILDLRYRYIVGNKVLSTNNFDFNSLIDKYVDLLNCSKNIVLVGPPSSSYYIGISKQKAEDLASHYGNMFIYDVSKPIGPFTASVLEDMTIVLRNSQRGGLGIFPFGLQVVCREPMATGDCYNGMSWLEYVEHHVIMTGCTKQNYNSLKIPYNKFKPKLLSEVYKK